MCGPQGFFRGFCIGVVSFFGVCVFIGPWAIQVEKVLWPMTQRAMSVTGRSPTPMWTKVLFWIVSLGAISLVLLVPLGCKVQELQERATCRLCQPCPAPSLVLRRLV